MTKNICLALLAHVDAGKTTTAEAMLFKSGSLRALGRVDRKNAYLDDSLLERRHGITVFSKQAIFDIGDAHINLLDTPGHADFSAEAERVLPVLDYAIMIISAPDGLQAHSLTLWSLLRRYRVPCFIWVNKMDISEKGRAEIIGELSRRLGFGFVDFNDLDHERIAELDEEAMEIFFSSEDGRAADFRGDEFTRIIQGLIIKRRLFPCYFGSSLKLDGTDLLMDGICKYTRARECGGEFSARVYKISYSEDGRRLTWLRLFGGELRGRDMIEGEKITQIRAYSGSKYENVEKAEAGNVYALCGLSKSFAGQGLGRRNNASEPLLRPVLSYRLFPPEGSDAFEAFRKLSRLAEEEPLLKIKWNDRQNEIEALLMGELQGDILKELISERFGMEFSIGEGRTVYKESIVSPVIGTGHFEPPRHYAEVHLLLEPLAEGAGLVFSSLCGPGDVDPRRQRLILSSLEERELTGVLTGAALCDMKISLIAAGARQGHGESGDFRQAAIRALRQGLMSADNILLEPYYDYSLELPSEYIGRAISDCKAMCCGFGAPVCTANGMLLEGRGPASELGPYARELASFSRGKGRLSFSFAGYFPCHNSKSVIEGTGYEPGRDMENPSDSVFCSHGEAVSVKWDKAPGFMHIESGIQIGGGEPELVGSPGPRRGSTDMDERELEAILRREFGEDRAPQIASFSVDFGGRSVKKRTLKKEYLIIDGYNIIYDWPELKASAGHSLASARAELMDILTNYRAYKGCELCVVFDGYKQDGPGSRENDRGAHVVYTKHGQSADAYIESLLGEIGRNYSVRVASSDAMIQLSALRAGVIRLSARELRLETDNARREIEETLRLGSLENIRLEEIARIKKQ